MASYIGSTPADSINYKSLQVQHFSTSSTATYTLDKSVSGANSIALFINNVRQQPGSSYAYTVSATTLTLSEAITSSDTMWCLYLEDTQTTDTVQSGNIAADAVDGTKLADNAIDSEHITADAVDGTKLADDAINSEHITDASIDNAHLGTDIDASKIATGTFANARISQASVTQHVTATDLSGVNADITALALREATNESSAAFNLPNKFIETFTDDTNLGTQTDGDRTSGYWGTAGTPVDAYESYTTNWHSASPARVITVSGMAQHGSSSPAYLLDGSLITPNGNNSNGQEGFLGASSGTISAGAYLQVDFGSGAAHKIIGYRGFEQGTGNCWGTNWTLQVSTDASSWTTPTGDGFTNGSVGIQAGVSTTISSSTHYVTTYNFSDNLSTTSRYFRFYSASGGTSNTSTWMKQMNFKMRTGGAVNATGTLIQSANAVGSNKTKVAGTMLYKDNSGTASLGTDLKIYFTCNGGTNWTEAASYNAITPVYSSGIKQVRLGETTCTQGTDIRYKAVWANQASGSKETQLHGIGTNY